MRPAASLAYLLARISDTVADSMRAAVDDRLQTLDAFGRAVAGEDGFDGVSEPLLAGVPGEHERRLLQQATLFLNDLGRLPADQLDLVRDVVGTIIEGQRMDLERFGEATAEQPVVLHNDGELHDYTWQVAGCVGSFWTQLGVMTLGDQFSSDPMPLMIERAIAYGKGLQMVNILRDLPWDLSMGRCYLPVSDPFDERQLLVAHQTHLEEARKLITRGFEYTAALKAKRLRASSVLPALLADETLDQLKGVTWSRLSRGVKVSRIDVYGLILRAIFY